MGPRERGAGVATPDRQNALDHVVVLMFENRSFDHMLGRLYPPGEVESFEGVIGKDPSNPIPEWAEHGADRGVVDYGVAKNMNTPYPDPGEERLSSFLCKRLLILCWGRVPRP